MIQGLRIAQKQESMAEMIPELRLRLRGRLFGDHRFIEEKQDPHAWLQCSYPAKI
jgi:hypothetical protein